MWYQSGLHSLWVMSNTIFWYQSGLHSLWVISYTTRWYEIGLCSLWVIYDTIEWYQSEFRFLWEMYGFRVSSVLFGKCMVFVLFWCYLITQSDIRAWFTPWTRWAVCWSCIHVGCICVCYACSPCAC